MLKPDITRVAGLLGLLIGVIFWNGISWFAFWAITFHDKGAPCFVKWMIWIFCGIGVLLFFGMIGQAIKFIQWGNTQVEVQKELLRPGDSTRVTIAQAGSFPIKVLKLTIVAQESATYRVGTKSRTDTYEIWSKGLIDKKDLVALGDRPIAESAFEIPVTAMHSFKGSSNRIDWFLRLEMEAPGMATVKEMYPIRVAPGEAR